MILTQRGTGVNPNRGSGVESLISLKGDDSAGVNTVRPRRWHVPLSAIIRPAPSAIREHPHDAILLVDAPTGDDRGADAEPGVGGQALGLIAAGAKVERGGDVTAA